MGNPNVLCLVLDCLRLDAITEADAPNIHALGEENLSFDACVTPANWSLPAHTSLFTGEWPHEHGYYHREHHLAQLPLVDALAAGGFDTVGVTANIYASSSHGFDSGFDRFYETRRPLNPRGLNPFAHVRKIQEERTPRPRDYVRTLVDAATHDRPLASLDNFSRAVALELDRRYGYRDYLPLIDADSYGFLTRASTRSTDLLVDEIERTADRSEPLFAFANYMDTHYPYEPPEEHFRAVADGRWELEDLRTMSPNLSNARTFRNQFFAGDIDEDDVELVRAAYRAEVRSVDEQVGRLLQALEDAGVRDETVVVVTSDHGEGLGETDLRGERSMGHLDALNEHLWTVPLIVAHPDLDARTIEDRTSLRALYDLLTGDLESFLDVGGATWDDYFDDDPVFFELPANPYHEESMRNYDYFEDWFVERESLTHTVLGFDGEWKVVADSRGAVSAYRGDEAVDVSDAPAALRTACEDAVERFPAVEGDVEADLSGDVEQQLRDLGYV
ncbi:sulfatase-like hydrolase/transferase [Haloplanus salinarum]